jgi:hypothetical protein
MSGCADVCLYSSYDGSNEFYSESEPTARKVYTCCECGDAIAIGQRYNRASGKYDGTIFTEHTCAVCTEIRKAFCCGTWSFGMLWEEMRDQMFPVWVRVGPFDCLAKLTTEAAREKCRVAYAQYQED